MEAAKNGDTTSVRAVLEKLSADSKTVVFDAVHETCRGNHYACLTLLLPYVETTQVGFGILLSECVHANHVACTEVLLQHWKSVCSSVAFVPRASKHNAGGGKGVCPAMWSDPAVCRVLIDAGADVHTKNKNGRSPLHYACKSGTLDVVKMLVEADARVRDTDKDGRTCLMLAAYNGHTETVRYLVGLPEVDVNHRDSEDDTALHHARRDADVVQVLLAAGADTEMKNSASYSPLHDACFSGALEVVKTLVEAGAGVRATDNQGDTCLTLAAYSGHTEIVRYLVGLPEVELNHHEGDKKTALQCAVEENHPADAQVLITAGADMDTKDNEGRSPLHYACIDGALNIVKMLVEAGAGVCVRDDYDATCLTIAAYRGHTETVRYLVGLPQVEVNLRNGNGCTALHCAMQHNDTEMVQVLIDAGADIDTESVHLASFSGALDVVKMLVRLGARVCVSNNTEGTCLMIAAGRGHTETVRYLLSLPEVELNHQDSAENTALHCAVDVCPIDQTSAVQCALVVQLLIDAGADIEMKNRSGHSPLHNACCFGALDIVKMFVEAGAGVRDTDNHGCTCFMLAVQIGHTETVRYLVGLREVDVNHQDSDDKTALHCAVEEKYTEIVQLLITAGADMDTKDNEGRSPLHDACCFGALDIVKMLVEAGAGVRATDNQGDTCLTIAAYSGHADIVRYLVGLPEVELLLYHRAADNKTAFHYALEANQLEIMLLLLAAALSLS